MSTNKWILDIIKTEPKKAFPILSFPSVHLLNISVAELLSSSELQAQGMKAIADRCDTLASVSMMDLSVEAEAFGAKLKTSADEVPTIIGKTVSDEAEAEALAVPKVGAGRTGRSIEAVAKACKLIADRPVLAGVIGPFSLAGRLADVAEIMMHCFRKPAMVHCLMEKTTSFLIDYINAYKDTGASGVVLAEPLTGLLSPKLAAKFSEPYVAKLVAATKEPGFAFVYHNCGNSAFHMIDSITRVDADAYHFGNAINMENVMAKLPADVLGMGNVDPSSQFCFGTPSSMKEETLRVMGECCKYPNFVISSGCDIPSGSSWQNIDAFFEAVNGFYAGK